MKVFHILFQLLLICNLAASRCYSPDQIYVCNNDGSKCFCRECPRCPPGYGLNQECSGSINQSYKLKCIPCVVGENYSSKNNTGTCQPCPHCHGHKMLHPCTPRSPTKCSPDECVKGFIWNSVVEICESDGKVTTTKPTPSISKTTPTKKHSSHASAASTPTSTPTPTSEKDHGSRDTAEDQSSHQHDSSSVTRQNAGLIIGIVLLIIIVACIATFLFWKRKKIYKFFRNKCLIKEDTIAQVSMLQDCGNEEPSPEVCRHKQAYPWPSGLRLSKIAYNNLRCKIQTKITNPQPHLKGWKELGKELKLSDDTLERIETYNPEERGDKFFYSISAEKPELPLSEFVDALKVINRIDIVELVKDFYTKKQPQQDVNEHD